MKSIHTLTFIFLFTYINCFSQIYSTHNYTPDDGIATRSVYDIAQDSTGRMWFSTGVGISRYDGYKFENFDFTKEVYKISYKRIKTDEKGFVWCIPYYTKDSIRVFKNNYWISIPPPENIKKFIENVSFDLYYENNKPVLCLGTTDGIYINKDNIWKKYSTDEGLIFNEALNVCASNNKFYISTKKGISVFSSGSFDNSINNIISEAGTAVLNINFQKLDGKEKMWILMPDKLGYIENNIFILLTKDFIIRDLTTYISYSMVFDKKGNIYFGSGWSKFYININKGKVVPLFKENGFISNGCTSIFLDREDNLWVSDTKGLCKLNSLAFRNHDISIGLGESDVSAVSEIIPGKFIFGHNSGYTIVENHKFKYFSFSNLKRYKQNANRVLDIFKDKTGNLWLAVFGVGIGKMDKSGSIDWMKTPDSIMFTSVISDKDGNMIASSSMGLYIKKGNNFEKFDNNDISIESIRKLYNINDGRIWAATLRGIYIIDNQNTKRILLDNNYLANSVYSIFKDNKGRIFAGTQDGLYIIQNDSMIKFRDNKFSIDDAVYTIIQDKNNNYWIGTSKNLVFWNGNEIIKEYNSKNGLVQGEINRSALFIDSEERLWIGTDMGVSRYISELDNEKSFIPKVELIGIIENGGNHYPVDKDISFSSKNNNIKFLYRGISFVNENFIEYKIKLEGFDEDWRDVNQSYIDDITYMNLKPGDYVFKVKARNPSGEWSSEVVSKKITIESQFYYKWWFIMLVLVIVTIGLYGFFYHQNRRKYLAKIETEVQKRTDELAKSKNDLVIANERLEERVKERTSELEESEKEFREVVEFLPEVIFETDTKGIITFSNMAGYEKYGYAPEDLGKTSIFDIVVPEYHEQTKNYFVSTISGNNIKGIEIKAFKKDGSIFPVFINTVPVYSNGEIKGIRGIAFDMTIQKINEEKLSKLSKEQKELIASKDKFFSILAHDLRNPFTGLYGFSQILQEEASELSKEEIVHYSGRIRNSAENLLGLLDNLLQWGRLQTGKMEANLENINLFEKIEHCISLLSHNANNKEITIFNNIKNDIYVKADGFMLDSIIQNFLMNSIKFTPKKGRIEFSAEISDDFVAVSLSDTGIGISNDQLENIFSIDKRNTTLGTEKEPGTGLGLILCKEMIEKQGGKLTIQSKVGKGSIFKFYLKY